MCAVCMYVSMHVCMYVCMYVCVCVCVCVFLAGQCISQKTNEHNVSLSCCSSTGPTDPYLRCFLLYFRFKCHLKFSWTIPRPSVRALPNVVSGFSLKIQMGQQSDTGKRKVIALGKTPCRSLCMFSYCIIYVSHSVSGQAVPTHWHPRRQHHDAACCLSSTLSGFVFRSSKVHLLFICQVVCLWNYKCI